MPAKSVAGIHQLDCGGPRAPSLVCVYLAGRNRARPGLIPRTSRYYPKGTGVWRDAIGEISVERSEGRFHLL